MKKIWRQGWSNIKCKLLLKMWLHWLQIGNIDEQVQTRVDIGETSMVDVSKIEVALEKTIDMVEKQKYIILGAMSK